VHGVLCWEVNTCTEATPLGRGDRRVEDECIDKYIFMNIHNKIATNVSILCFSNCTFLAALSNKNFGNCCRVSYWHCKFLALIHPLYRDSKLAKYLTHPTCLGKEKNK